MYELPQELPNELKLKVLRNQEIVRKSLNYLDLMASTQPATRKTNFDTLLENREKSAVKHSIEKS